MSWRDSLWAAAAAAKAQAQSGLGDVLATAAAKAQQSLTSTAAHSTNGHSDRRADSPTVDSDDFDADLPDLPSLSSLKDSLPSFAAFSLPSNISLPQAFSRLASLANNDNRADNKGVDDNDENERLLSSLSSSNDDHSAVPITEIHLDDLDDLDIPSLVIEKKSTTADTDSTTPKRTQFNGYSDHTRHRSKTPDSLYRLSHYHHSDKQQTPQQKQRADQLLSQKQESHNELTKEQDSILESMRDSIQHLTEISSEIRQEVTEHQSMLETVDGGIGDNQSLMETQTKAIQALLNRTGWSHGKVICVMLTIIFVLLFLIIYT